MGVRFIVDISTELLSSGIKTVNASIFSADPEITFFIGKDGKNNIIAQAELVRWVMLEMNKFAWIRIETI